MLWAVCSSLRINRQLKAWRRGTALSVSFAAAIACGDDTSGVAVFCQAECDSLARCGVSIPAVDCVRECSSSRSGLHSYRRETLEVVAACIREIDCAAFFEPDAYVPCWEHAEAEVDPTAQTRAFCADFSEVWFECGASFSTSECESEYGILTDEFLSELAECNASPPSCKDFEACSDAVWEAR